MLICAVGTLCSWEFFSLSAFYNFMPSMNIKFWSISKIRDISLFNMYVVQYRLRLDFFLVFEIGLCVWTQLILFLGTIWHKRDVSLYGLNLVDIHTYFYTVNLEVNVYFFATFIWLNRSTNYYKFCMYEVRVQRRS